MGKIKETRQLYKEVLKEIAENEQNWREFLNSSSWNFKYDFDDQILIYAQRPDARACATMDEWNKKLKRWVNSGTKPIYIFDKNPYSEYPFKLVFDLSDTHNYNNTEYKLWSIKQDYEEDIIESLEASFGDISLKDNLPKAIIDASYNMVVDNIEDYLTSVINNKAGSMLENLSDEEIRSIVTTTTWASVSYMLMTRCGIDAKEQIQEQEFSYIKYFNNQEVLTTLGASVSDIAEMGLREIAKTVAILQKKEKLKNRTFAKNDDELYSKDNEKIKGGIEDGRENRIHETGRILYAEPNNAKGENTSREILSNEIQLSKESQELRIDQFSNEQETNGTFNTNTGTSEQESTEASRGNEETRGNNGRIESSRPNKMGGAYEQHTADSRGNSSKRANIHLEETSSQRRILSKEEQKTDKYYLQDKYVSALLSNTQNLKASKNDIKEFYKSHLDLNERTEYIKQVFNDAYTEIVVDDVRLGYKTYENVLHLWKDDYLNRTAEVYYNWNTVAEYIEGLIMVNEFNDLHKPVPSYDDQMQILQVEVENAPTFSFTQEIIDYVLQGGSNVQESKMRIYNQFEQSLSSQENIKFLKHEYGWGGSSSIYIGTRIGIDYDGQGIKLHRGYEDDAPKITIPWHKVEKRISELIKADRYLNLKEKEEYSNWLKQKETEEQLRESKKQLIEESKSTTLEGTFSKYEYHLGDTVYIGAEEYEIAGITDDIVTLYDPKFPLFNKQMDFEEFEQKVQENYSNDHLKIGNRQNEKVLEDNKIQLSNEKEQIEQTKVEEQPVEYKEIKENIKPNFIKVKNKIQDFILHPEVPINDRNNYRITDNDLGVGTPREKFAKNIEAIKVLKKCEQENRYATPEEQEVLSKYVGWGGLAQAFDKDDSSWSNEYHILKELLDEEEYKNARSSTLTAFYTPPIVINAMYEILQNMGVKEANILEPSCRSWKFLWYVTKRT